MGILLSLFFGFAPMFLFAAFVYWLDRYEKEPVLLLGIVFFWGAVIAAGSAFVINTVLGIGVYLFSGSEVVTDFTTGTFIAPIVEESLKGLAVLVIFLVFYGEFDSLLDGLIYAAVVALGFAATENAFYIFQYGYSEAGMSGLFGMVFVRVILVGWQHPFYTAFTGIGLAFSRLNRNILIKVFSPVVGWGLAVFTHSVHNTLASLLSGGEGLVFGTFVDWTGWFFMFLVVLWAIHRDKVAICTYLQDEISKGSITSAQYKIACSPWAINKARINALFSGHYRATNRFYQTCAELAHKKNQYALLGEERGNREAIERLRAELSNLSILAGS